MKDLVDIHVREFKEGNFWIVSAQSLNDRNDDQEEPQEFGEPHDFPKKELAVGYAEEWAKQIMKEKTAKAVCIILEGNEHKFIELGETVPNLDSMDYDELSDFWMSTNSVRPMKKARELFPDRPTGYLSATKGLGHYAINRATAIRCRKEGKIPEALKYEEICGVIYKSLPDYAKW